MTRRKKPKKSKKAERGQRPPRLQWLILPEETQKWIFGILMFLGAAIIILSFFESAGFAGRLFFRGFSFLIGKVVFLLPLVFVLGGIVLFHLKNKDKWHVLLAVLIIVAGLAGSFGSFSLEERNGGFLGFVQAIVLVKMFGVLAAEIIFLSVIAIGAVILIKSLPISLISKGEQGKTLQYKDKEEKTPKFIKKVFQPKFRVKEVVSAPRVQDLKPAHSDAAARNEFETLKTESLKDTRYQPPPVDLLEGSKEVPIAGDLKINSAIIKKTLQNFNIPVEMSEVNIGPTVTQYTLKPAEGIKLSRITSLASDLSLALAAPSIRIEAPIPGRPLVGIEVPNKSRVPVKLRDLIEHPNFQNSPLPLLLALGKDVSGNLVFADLSRMPHLLVAGSTGTGKTVCLNSIISSLLYRNGPEILRFILVDPKRVEFTLYAELPHLLTPVIHDAQKTINAIKWLVAEMERRFEALSSTRSRDIFSYNEKVARGGLDSDFAFMPYIVLIIDELADLMAARGRELEAGIVRLAQMARAVGIHLILATQRPSVEVITGLIKANITSRIAFQVASQVDSRTILDVAGAEKLLGLGDMLFISTEVPKPKRVQGAIISEKEIKRVVSYIKSQQLETIKEDFPEQELAKEIEERSDLDVFSREEDPLYEEAKKVVIEARKASASLLQRRLRLGYARAARLIDMLEERGVVGPGEGAKPREVYIQEDKDTPE